MISKPSYWFKTIKEIEYITTEPEIIEYLLIPSGETYIHTGGTVFWNHTTNSMDISKLKDSKITHWRIPSNFNERKNLTPTTRKQPNFIYETKDTIQCFKI